MGCPDFSPDEEQANFGQLYDVELTKYADSIKDETEKAQKQYNIFLGLEDISEEWEKIDIKVIPHKPQNGKGYKKIDKIDPILETLEKHMMKLSTFKTSFFAKAFSKRIEQWD